MTNDEFIIAYHKKFIAGKLIHFLDASPLTEHTCCVGQWHEYLKHGCREGNSFSDWDSAVDACIKNFDPNHLYVDRCRYDHRLQCNHVEEVSSLPLEVHDCKQDKPFCHENCVKD